MTNEEIKKAFNKFKKDAEKELSFSLSGCCYMNKRQIENRTATICLCNNHSYEWSIAHEREIIDQVMGYESWTEEAKQRSKADSLKDIERYEALLKKYGTKENEACEKLQEIVSSASFDRFNKALGYTVIYQLELVNKWKGLDVYQIRLSY